MTKPSAAAPPKARGKGESPRQAEPRKPLLSGPGGPGRIAPRYWAAEDARVPGVTWDNQGGTVEFPPLTKVRGGFFREKGV